VANSEFGEIVAAVHQNPGHEWLGKHQELEFESFVCNMAQQHIESIPTFVNEVLAYLFVETQSQTFKYTVYEDWLRAKKEYEQLFGIVPDTYVPPPFHPF